MHRARVRAVRRVVDTSEPCGIQMDHVRNNLKKEQMLEERYSEIDRDNRILLKKMSDIMQNGSLQTPRPGDGRVLGPVSLNRDARKKELFRITKENHVILRRIQQAQPFYNHVEMEGIFKKSGFYLKNASEFPVLTRTPRRADISQSEMHRLESGHGFGQRFVPNTGSVSSREPLPPKIRTAAQPSKIPAVLPQPPSSAGTRPITVETGELDADPMVSTGFSTGLLRAEIELGATTGDAQFRMRGFTPQLKDKKSLEY